MTVLLPFRRYLLGAAWSRNLLWKRARAVPSLDLDFAGKKSLKDGISNQDLITFTRASSATYTDSAGVLQSAVTNLLLQSENFTTTWTNFLSTDAANTAIAPNGTLTADTLIPDSGATAGLIRQDFSGATFTDNASISFSIYVKAAGLTNFNLQFYNKANTFHGGQTVNASTGALSGVGTLASTVVTDAGDGWYRVSMTGMSSGTGATGPNLRIVVTSTGDGTSGIYLWGAQLEQSSTVGEYIPTTSTINSAPRFDHNPTTGESLGLLVEEARTNLALRSEEFNNASWVKTDLTVTANTNETVAPNGINTADLYDDGTNSGTHYLAQTAGITASTTYTAFIYAKKDNLNYINVGIADIAVGDRFAVASFNINNGTVSASSASGTGYSVLSTSISFAGNGWYRCVIALTTGSTAVAPRFIIASSTDGMVPAGSGGLQAYAGANNQTYIWGAQLEAGAFPTSYIPTTSATVTRAADVASIGSSAFTSFYNQSEGTMFVDFLRAYSGNFPNFPNLYQFNDGTNDNEITVFGIQGGQLFQPSVVIGASSQVNFVTFASIFPGPNRCAHSLSLNNSVFAGNGVLTTPDTSVNLPTVNQVKFGERGGQRFTGHYKRICFWRQALPGATLQAITG